LKILVIKIRNIGDTLLMTPLIKNLKLNTDAKIDVLINEESKSMLTHNPNINEIIIYPRKIIKNSKFKILKDINFLFQIIKRKYDIIINLTEGDRGAIISLFSNSKKTLGYLPKNRFLKFLKPYDLYKESFERIHSVERDLSFLKLLNFKVFEKKLEIFDNNLKIDLPKNYVLIHPVAKWKFKYWERDRFAKVIDYIKSKNYEVILTSSPNEYEKKYLNDIYSLCGKKPLLYPGKFSLEEMKIVVKNAKLFLGVDTAIMHMASAYDIPIVALFGHSDADIWGPWENSMEKSCFNNEEKVQKCGKHYLIKGKGNKIFFEKGEKKSEAMFNIKTEDVSNVLKNIL
jgi:heptosyltransferase-3